MSNEAIAAPQGQSMGIGALQQGSTYTDDLFKKVSGSRGAFLPRLQLFTSNSTEVKKGLIDLASYGIIKKKTDPIIKLGKNVLCSPLTWRAKALDMRNLKQVMAYHNPADDTFLRVREIAESGEQDTKCMFGPEFLMFVPEHGFVAFFMGSATARNEATALRPFITDPPSSVTLSAEYIENLKKGLSWHGPKVTASEQILAFPPAEEVFETVTKFLKPKDSVPEEEAEAGQVNAER